MPRLVVLACVLILLVSGAHVSGVYQAAKEHEDEEGLMAMRAGLAFAGAALGLGTLLGVALGAIVWDAR